MSISDAAALVWRRRWLALLCVIGIVAAAVTAGYRVVDGDLASRFPSRFETTAVVSLVPGSESESASESAEAPAAFDALEPGRLQGVGKSLAVVLDSPGFAERLRDSEATSPGANVTATATTETNVLRVAVDAGSPAAASDAMGAVLEEVQPAIDRYAAGAPLRFPLRANLVEGPSSPREVASLKSPLASAVAGLVALLVAWALLLVVDGVPRHATRLWRRRPPVDNAGRRAA